MSGATLELAALFALLVLSPVKEYNLNDMLQDWDLPGARQSGSFRQTPTEKFCWTCTQSFYNGSASVSVPEQNFHQRATFAEHAAG